MKTLAVLALCLAISVSLQTCSLTDALNTNKDVLNFLKNKGVAINSQPDTKVDSSICNGEFTANGTCCEVGSLRNFISQNNNNMILKWRNYIGKLARIKGKFASGFNKVAAKMNVKDIQNKMANVKSNPKIAAKFKNAPAVMPETSEEIVTLRSFFSNFNQEVQNFKTQGKICFDALKQARANVMCAACSDSASTFSQAQNSTSASYKIDQASCNALVAQCFSVWRMNFLITSMLQYISVNLSKKKGDKSDYLFKSQKTIPSDDLDIVKQVLYNCTVANSTNPNVTSLSCPNATISAQNSTNILCTTLFSVTLENGYVEGDETIDAGVSDDDVQTADQNVDVPSRILADGDLDIGVAVAPGSSSAFTNLNSNTNALIPAESVTTSNAGDQPNFATLARTAVVSLVAAVVCLL